MIYMLLGVAFSEVAVAALPLLYNKNNNNNNSDLQKHLNHQDHQKRDRKLDAWVLDAWCAL